MSVRAVGLVISGEQLDSVDNWSVEPLRSADTRSSGL